MKGFLTILALFTFAPLHGQSWDLGAGLSAADLEVYAPYSSPSRTVNLALTLGYSTPIGLQVKSYHDFRIAFTIAPKKNDQAFSYDYIGVGAYYVGTNESGRFSWTGGLALRRETYGMNGFRLYSPPNYQNFTLLSEDTKGRMIRPYLGVGIVWKGLIVPFRQDGRVKLQTRLLVEKGFLTPDAEGWEGELRKHLNQTPVSALQIGVSF